MKTICLAVVVSLGVDCGILQASTPTTRDLKLASQQLQGMNDGLEQLVSGIFRVVGTDDRAYVPDPAKRKRPIKAYCAFDYARGLFRFDQDTGEVVKIHQELPGEPVHTEPLQVPLRAMYIRTPEFSLHWATEDEVKRKVKDARPFYLVKPFNVRCMGLSFISTLDRYRNCRAIFESYAALEVREVVEAEEVCRVVFVLDEKGPDPFFTIWFDRKQGGLPGRLEMCRGTSSSPPLQRSDITWQQISKIWVPKKFMGADYDSPGKLSRKMELAFEWESVNQAIPERVFTPEGMDLPPWTRIVSYELGVRVELGTIGNVHREMQALLDSVREQQGGVKTGSPNQTEAEETE